MAYEFKVGYDSIANFDSEPYNDKEVSHFLTKSQERFIKSRYDNMRNITRDGFDETERRKNELDELIRGPRDKGGTLLTSKANDRTQALRDETLFRMPLDYWLLIYEEVELSSSDPCLDGTITTPTPVIYDHLSTYKNNPHRGLNNGRVFRVEYYTGDGSGIIQLPTKRVGLFTGSNYDVNNYFIRYIKWPKEIKVDESDPSNQVNSELNQSTHREIVDGAIELALEVSQNPRLKTRTQTDKNIQQ